MSNKTVAIVLAAGRGKRMNSQVQKQYLTVKEKPVLFYSLKVFQDSFIDEVILVVGKDDIEYCKKEIIERYELTKVKKVVTGGSERYHSVFEGLKAANDCNYVFIHDGARPFITEDILCRAYESVKKYDACVVGMPVKDTIKIANETGMIHSTPKREMVWQIQTPQCFSYELANLCYCQLMDKEADLVKEKLSITDDAMVVETFSEVKIKLVEGSYRNIKITTPEDLFIAEAFLK